MCELDVAKDPSSNLSSLNLVGNLKREHSIKSLSSCSKIGPSERITMLATKSAECKEGTPEVGQLCVRGPKETCVFPAGFEVDSLCSNGGFESFLIKLIDKFCLLKIYPTEVGKSENRLSPTRD